MHVVGRKPKRYTARGQSDRQGTPPVGPDIAEQFSQFPVYRDGLQNRPGVFRTHPVKLSSTLANHLALLCRPRHFREPSKKSSH